MTRERKGRKDIATQLAKVSFMVGRHMNFAIPRIYSELRQYPAENIIGGPLVYHRWGGAKPVFFF